MPKKIDKKKKVIKKKATKKPKETKPKETKPKATPIIIYTQKLPRTKCCVDGEKTGEAYSIPFGFRDLAGTQRLSQTLVPQSNIKPITPVKESISIQTQTNKPKPKLIIYEDEETQTDKEKPTLIMDEETQTEDKPIRKRKPSAPLLTKEEKKELDRQKALSKLNDLFLLNYSTNDALNLTTSYNYQSISQINKRIKKEKELSGKLKS
jgi:hypothetical protein